MSNRLAVHSRVLCMLCDATYDPGDAQESAIHQHPEPQSGVFRMAWLRSGMPYQEWLNTAEGEEWAAYRATILLDPREMVHPAQHVQPPVQVSRGFSLTDYLSSSLPYSSWIKTPAGQEWQAYWSLLHMGGNDIFLGPALPHTPTLILPGEGCRARLTLLNSHNVEVTGEVRVGEEWRAIRSYCIPRHIWEAAGRLFETEK